MKPNCLACGECCKKLTINLDVSHDNNMRELFRIHYGKDTPLISIKLKHRCPHLDESNRCRIYDSPERPEVCRTWYCEAALGKANHAIRLELEDK